LTDPQVKDKFAADDKTKLETAVDAAIAWLEKNQEGLKEEYEHKQKELEEFANPIMSRLYGGAGGAGGMPGFGDAAGGAAGGADQGDGPTIEEVD